MDPLTNEIWMPKIAPAIEDPSSAIRQMDWEEAQEWCNFALLRPAVLPGDLSIEKMEMRPESPPGRLADDGSGGRSSWTVSNRSAHRLILRARNRALRLKQFLYDWAPPAFDHPSLWLSATVTPYPIDDDVGWLGTDYRKLKASAASLHRTTLELSVIEGEFADSELESVLQNLQVVSPDALTRINRTSFAQLSYQSRHVSEVIAVPVGYWAYKREPSSLRTTPLDASEIPPNYLGRAIVPPLEYGYVLDSCFALGNPESPREVEYVYQDSERPNWYVRVLVWPVNRTGALPYPPELDRQPCFSERLKAHGIDVYYAYGSSDYGSHEIVWKTNEFIVMLVVKPKRGSDRKWFLSFMDQVVGASLNEP